MLGPKKPGKIALTPDLMAATGLPVTKEVTALVPRSLRVLKTDLASVHFLFKLALYFPQALSQLPSLRSSRAEAASKASPVYLFSVIIFYSYFFSFFPLILSFT
jgi:hypothetical protein